MLNLINKYKIISGNYKNIPFVKKLFLLGRWLSAPYEEIESLCPKKSVILDVGCSYGLLDLLLVLNSSNRKILGIDPSTKKIKLAKSTTAKTPRQLIFIRGSLSEVNISNKFDIILLIDVLYLLPQEEKFKLLLKAKQLLKKNGLIIINNIDTKPGLFFLFAYFQEYFSVLLTKLTFSLYKKLYFMSQRNYNMLFNRLELKIFKEVTITKLFLYHYHLVVLKNRSLSPPHAFPPN